MDSPLALLAVLVASVATALLLQRIVPLRQDRPQLPHRLRRNIGMSLLVLVAGGLSGGLMAAPAAYAEDHGTGLLRALDVPPPLQALVGVAALELAFYWLHRAEHSWAPLWRIHRAHHTDLDLDVTTSIRSHPADIVLSNAVLGLLVVLPLGLSPLFVAGYNLGSFAVVWLQHARTDLPAVLDRPLSAVLASPGNHRMHHSSLQAETDSNYGSNLILFDRLFGTWTRPRPDVVFGLDQADLAGRQSIAAMLAEPFRPRTRQVAPTAP